ncbi:MAG TPA: hypothetical protein VMG62_03165, partial [Solirubrobacteraceae bacterium]|nr:hypothetical protein [Solirubrobacteraceae bacterium]
GGGGGPLGGERERSRSLLSSRELWATVDVCNPADQRYTIGIRGSMPGDGHPRDTMYMAFELQYLEGNGTWGNLSKDGSSGFIAVGSAKTTRQGGTSFQLMAVQGKGPFTMRGLATFQWRHGRRVVHEATRTTSAGHTTVADADPAGYSAARCSLS